MPFGGVLTMGLISGGTSLLGGFLGNRAAGRAAEIQSRTAREVADRARGVAGESAGYVANAGETAAGGVENAANGAVGRIDAGTAEANGLLNPYVQGGQRGIDAMSALLDPSAAFQFDENNPAYQFNLNQQLKAYERSAAARGGALGGGAVQGTMRLASNFAANEYEKEFQRYLQQRQQTAGIAGQLYSGGLNATGEASGNVTRGAALGAGMQTDAARAAGGFRLGAAESAGNMRLGGENIAGNAITGGANAQAAGVVGGANAWNQALGGFNQTAQNLWTLDQLRPRPQQPQGGFQQQPVAGVNTQIVQPGYRIGG